MFKLFAASAALVIATASAGATLPDGSWPSSKGLVQFSEVRVIKAGEVFDGKMQTFERSNVKCNGQSESGWQTGVFFVEAGGHLKNAIIGKNQMEGVHCDQHDCIIENVWWDDVCEDALSIKGGSASSVSKIIGGGARYADDKVIQQNGLGKVIIDGFYAEDVSKLYRSCGTCGPKAREVSVSNVLVVNPTNAVVTVNKNWGDKATLRNIWVKSSKASVKRVHINQDIKQAKQTSPEDPKQTSPNPDDEYTSQTDITPAPKTKASKTTAPKATTPTVTKASKTKTPKTKTPATTPPKKTKAPKTKTPKTEAPVTNPPKKTKAPKTKAPSQDQQDVEQQD
ncbi:hypothetical protein PR003_g24805 [Phytophthora rubi]|uniref:Probable pectate lyase F n=3 Tax=Phytophthora rubi TaxID=129364 RepID=A0A6A4CJH3_9STRA|nr:hypothetical protein PR003_g24805 [Phytophthora rubi]